MRIRDRGNNREAQPGTSCGAGSAAETLERARHEIRRETLSLIDDVQFEEPEVLGGFEP
jgi:hypothetical protein